MDRLVEFDAGRDSQGKRRKIEYFETRTEVIEVVKAGGRMKKQLQINYSKQKFFELTDKLVDARQQLDDSQSDLMVLSPQDSYDEKVDRLEAVLEQFTSQDIERLRHSQEQLDNMEAVEALNDTPSDKDVEKIKEDVLQLIYEEYGFDWFTMPQFRKVYDINYNRSEAHRYLQQLEGRWLRKQEIPEDERSGQTKYHYKLGSSAQRVIQEYGAFDTKEYPVYKKKCKEYKN